MRIECPACSASGTIDESKVPLEGREVICPRCGKRFEVHREKTAVEIIQQRERAVCPKCGCEQPLAEICAICGIVIKNYMRTQIRQQEKERLELSSLRTATRNVDAWYKDLFDRRLGSLLTRVLSLLILLVIFMTCSMNSAKRNRIFAENTAEMRKATEGQGNKASQEKNDSVFREKFLNAADLMINSTDACIGQIYNYKTSLSQGYQGTYLSGNTMENLNRINMQRSQASSAVNALPYPSEKYHDCYTKMRELSNINGQVCGMVREYTSFYQGLNERLSSLNFEFSKIRNDLNVCKDTVK